MNRYQESRFLRGEPILLGLRVACSVENVAHVSPGLRLGALMAAAAARTHQPMGICASYPPPRRGEGSPAAAR